MAEITRPSGRRILAGALAAPVVLGSIVANAAGPVEALPPGGITTITPQPAVATTAHYQSARNGTCALDTCSVDFPALKAGQSLQIDFVSCFDTGGNGTWTKGTLQAVGSGGAISFTQYLFPAFQSPDTAASVTVEVSQAADVRIAAGQHARVSIQTFDESGHVSLTCSIAGTLTTQ
jgi:hypothetical protein